MGDPADVTATTVPTRLGPLHVQTLGSGPPAVLWHSLFVDSTTWVRVRQPLAAERRLLLIDGPAHGHNPPVARRFTLDDCAGAAADVLDRLGIGEPTGCSGRRPGPATPRAPRSSPGRSAGPAGPACTRPSGGSASGGQT
jgi:hypothetical protein